MGERFAGRYELLDPLGEGGTASVWRAWDEREGRVVAAKVLRQSDAVSLLRFLREQAVRVAGEHVLTPLGWAGEDDRVLFTMPIVDGGSVETLVGDFGPLPPGLVVELLAQLLDALEVAHRGRIVHRDVKPANLLLVATGRGRPHLLLSDFGIAVDLDGPRFTQTGTVVGTPGFVAPEVLAGAEPTPAADLYAAGRVGLFMLTGSASGVTPDGGSAGPEAPERLARLLDALTSVDPQRRPASAADARARLAAPPDWDPGGLGEVELFAHVGPDPQGRPQLLAGRPDDPPVGPPVAPALEGGVPPPAAPPVSARHRRPSGLVVAVMVLAVLGVLALLLAWAPWAATAGTGSRPATTGSASDTSTSLPTTATPSARTTSATGPASTTAAPSGSVSVGTIVSVVGQSCDPGAVGTAERTTAGDAVVCQRRADGTYAWDPPPG